MAKSVHDLLRKVSSVSVSAAALLSGSHAAGSLTNDPDTIKRTQDALDALKRGGGAEADQVRFHAGGQVDPQAQEILLAGHTSHSSHVSGSYIRGSGSSSDSNSTYTPATPAYTPSYYAPSSTSPASTSTSSTPSSSTPAPAPKVSITYRSGVHLAGTVIQRGSWGLQLLLKDSSRIQIPRRKLRAEDITSLELPAPKIANPQDVPPMVYLRLNDGTTYTGQVSAADGEQIRLMADDKTSQTYQRTQMDPETFIALQELTPDTPPPLAPPSPAAAVTPPVPSPTAAQTTPVVVGQQVLIKLKRGVKMLVTLLSKTDDEIIIRTKDGHEYRVAAAHLSTETLAALQMPVPEQAITPSPKHKAK